MDGTREDLRMPRLYVSSPEPADDMERTDEFQSEAVDSLIQDANKVLRSLDSNLGRFERQDSFADVSDSASDYKLDVRISNWLDENELSEFKDTFNKEQVVLQQLAGNHADRELAEMGMKNLKDRMKTISFARKALEAGELL